VVQQAASTQAGKEIMWPFILTFVGGMLVGVVLCILALAMTW
jgi:Cu/Ag efflux pump CusA